MKTTCMVLGLTELKKYSLHFIQELYIMYTNSVHSKKVYYANLAKNF